MLAERRRDRPQISEDESIALDGHTGFDGDGAGEHRSIVRECVEFAAFAAWIDAGRKILQQRRIEFASGETRVELFRIHARDSRAQTAGDHVARELWRFRIAGEKWKQRRQSAAGELLLAVL